MNEISSQIMMVNNNALKAIAILLMTPLLLFAQLDSTEKLAKEYLNSMHEEWGLTQQDVQDLEVSSMHTDQRTGLTHVYLNQQINGIPVYNAIANVHLSEDRRVYHATHRFINHATAKTNTSFAVLTPDQAIRKTMSTLNLTSRKAPTLIKQFEGDYLFDKGGISRENIPVKLTYYPTDDGQLRLAWDMSIDQVNSSDYWSLRIDAVTGDLLHKTNWTVYCSFPHSHDEDTNYHCEENPVSLVSKYADEKSTGLTKVQSDGAKYNVFELPLASPDEGDRTLVEEPADPVASPFGWHDTDGANGPEYTITRGNNAHAFLDRNGDSETDGNEPDGGNDLFFDFPFDSDWEPYQLTDAGAVNMFYVTNMMHDIAYHYGFDEVAGNFQVNNYGNGGIPNDPVRALGQFGGADPLQSSDPYLNNANFATPADGGSGRMRMYLWDKTIVGGDLLNILAPSNVAGPIQATTTVDFGVPVDQNPVTGDVVIVDDGTSQGSKGCMPLINGDEISGNIAMIDRGDCDFSDKIYKAQQAGAIGVIICNYEDAYVNMGGGDFANEVEIPAVFITSSDCQQIRIHAGDGLTATLQQAPVPGPDSLAGDFANGIIAHEYGHGISTRLTGGSATANCLFNEEQMGEGWSDFFQLITTAKVDEISTDPQYIGSYVLRNEDRGLPDRLYPYSTDFTSNPSTYADITRAIVPWGLGSVWATMLWDLYWAFTDLYGYDPDLINGSGGNNMAIQLVMEGMKLQPCSPGFVDGRDAILVADSILYNAAHSCLIWDVFARRGLGYTADQGDPFSRLDPVESYESLPSCIKELKIEKQMTALIEAGETVSVTIEGVNHKEEVANQVIVTDEIPNGMDYVPGSANLPAQLNGNLLQWELGDLASGDSLRLTYELQSSEDLFSVSHFYDDMESGDGNWNILDVENFFIWLMDSEFSKSGYWSWTVPDLAEENEQLLFLREAVPLDGDQPVLRFWHMYDTEPWFDGGVVEISTDGGNTFEDLAPYFFRKPYDGEIKGNALGLRKPAFWGNSNGWIESYADLSKWKGESAIIQFHFGSDAEVGGNGWYIDDVEIMDAHNYNSTVCITSEDGDEACASAKEYGTIVQPGIPTSVNDLENRSWSFLASPNPATDQIHINIHSQKPISLELNMYDVTGKPVKQEQITTQSNVTVQPLDISSLNPGFYLIELSNRQHGFNQSQKMIIH